MNTNVTILIAMDKPYHHDFTNVGVNSKQPQVLKILLEDLVKGSCICDSWKSFRCHPI